MGQMSLVRVFLRFSLIINEYTDYKCSLRNAESTYCEPNSVSGSSLHQNYRVHQIAIKSNANFCVAVIQEPRPVLIASTTAKMLDQLRNWCILHESMTAFAVRLLVLFVPVCSGTHFIVMRIEISLLL